MKRLITKFSINFYKTGFQFAKVYLSHSTNTLLLWRD